MSEVNKIPLSDLKLLEDNPRIHTTESLNRMIASIEERPWMLETHPIIIDENSVIIAGNLRYKALVELEHEFAYVDVAKNYTEEEIESFILLDNLHYGVFEEESITKDYSEKELFDMGAIHVLSEPKDTEKEKVEREKKERKTTIVLSFLLKDHQQAKEAIDAIRSGEHDLGEVVLKILENAEHEMF